MTDEQLQAIQRRADDATPGRWEAKIFDVLTYDSQLGRVVPLFEAFTDNHEDNCTFVAHARADIPALLAEVQRLRSLLAERVVTDKDAIVEAVARWGQDAMGNYGYEKKSPYMMQCPFCFKRIGGASKNEVYPDAGRHSTDCTILKARAILDAWKG